jgi:hypothetical protein
MPLTHLANSLFADPSGLVKTIRLWLNKKRSERRHVFIVGIPRAGTTLLKSMLVAHSRMWGIKYETTGILYTVRNETLRSIEEMPDISRLQILNASTSITDYYDAISSALMPPECLHFVDKASPRSWLLRDCVKRFPNALFIAPIRDPRDGWCSAKLHGRVYEAKKSARYYATRWQTTVKGLLKLSNQYSNIMIIRYEDLAKDPSTIIGAVMDRLGLEFEQRQVLVEGYASVTDLGSTINHQNLKKPIGTNSVGRWRHELSEEELKAFNVCVTTMREVGYKAV